MIWGDLETFNEVPITQGTYKYADTAEVTLFSYAQDDDPWRVWDLTTTPKMPGDLEYLLYDCIDEPVCFHNSMFDRTILQRSKNLRVPLPIERVRCTMVKALAHSLPGKLERLCEVLKVPQDKRKLKEGHDLVMLFCKPRPKNSKIRRATRETHPQEWQQFLSYAGHDIEAMRAVDAKLPVWNYRAAELALWHLDQRINDRGFRVDLDLADAAVRAVEREQHKFAARTKTLTNDVVASTSQRDQLLAHILEAYGVDLPNMQAATLERRVDDPDLPIELRELLAIRLQANTTSTTKYKTLQRSVSDDGRLRGTMQFDGALRTGRVAHRLFQPGNMPRMNLDAVAEWHGLTVPEVKPAHIQEFLDCGIGMLKADCADLVFDNVMALSSSAIRSCIVAPPGKKLVVADLANIEGRMAAWLAGEEWKLQAFRDYDTIVGIDAKGEPIRKGPDLYRLAYAKAFNITPAEVGKPERQIGKVMELMLQYQGGVGAFITGATTYEIDLDAMAEAAWPTLPGDVVYEAEGFLEWCRKEKRPTFGLADRTFIVCDSLKRLWRRAHPGIVSLWKELEDSIIAAIENPGQQFNVRVLKIRCDGAWLRIMLPSGRYLCYPSPHIVNGKISYMGVNQYTRKWQRIYSYGGKFFENIDQAGSRDVLFYSMPDVEAAGYAIVLDIHDEDVTEAPDTDDYNVAALCALLTRERSWSRGLPLAAAGFETYTYRKE